MLGRSYDSCEHPCAEPELRVALCVHLCVSRNKGQQRTVGWGSWRANPLPGSALCASWEASWSGRALTPVSGCWWSSRAPEQPWPTDLEVCRTVQGVPAVPLGLLPKGGVQARGHLSDVHPQRMAPVWLTNAQMLLTAFPGWFGFFSASFWAFCETTFCSGTFPSATISVWKNF